MVARFSCSRPFDVACSGLIAVLGNDTVQPLSHSPTLGLATVKRESLADPYYGSDKSCDFGLFGGFWQPVFRHLNGNSSLD